MVRKKSKRKQITSTQIFIILLFVLIVAFGAIYLFSQSEYNLVGQGSSDSCSSKGIADSNPKFLCDGKKWVECKDNWIGPEKYDDKYFCPGKSQPEWLTCDQKNKDLVNKNKEMRCDGKVWVKCDATQEKKTFGDSLFCKDNQWQKCSTETKDTLQNGLLCKGTVWTKCENLLADTTSSDGKYTCTGGIWDTTASLTYELSSGYELTFAQNKPLSVKDLNTEFSFCTGEGGDNPIFTEFLVLCQNDQKYQTLDKNVLFPITIDSANVAFLYQYTDDTKVGSLFLRKDLGPQEQIFDANEFGNAMVTGKRIALQFENRIYLLEHGKANIFSLLNMKLKIYGESTVEIYEAKGSVNKVEFLLPEGKIILQADTTGNVPVFKISALTKAEIVSQEIDLNNELSVIMSSEYAVKINDHPKLGTIKAHADDLNLDADSFKVEFEGVSKLALAKGVPYVKDKGTDGSALLYYDEINIQGDKAIKSLYVFQHFDITNTKKSRDYNNEFIKTSTGGNEFVVQYKQAFYRVSYADPPKDSVTLFSLEKLQLKSLDGKNTYVPKDVNLEKKTVTFIVPEGGIVFEKKDEQNLLEFHTQSEVELTTQEFKSEDYSTILTENTPVKVNGATYQLVDSGFTSTLDSQARIIKGNSADTFKVLKKDQLEVVDGNKLSLSHLFWYKGRNAEGVKEISVQPIVVVTNSKVIIDDWGDILAKAKDAKSKAIWWQNEYFDLVGDQKLASYSLRTIPEGNTYPIQNIKVADDETENGTFAYKEHLLFAKQVLNLNTTEASLELTPVTHQLLTVDGLNTSIYSPPLIFVTSVGGPLYSMSYTKLNNNLIVTGGLVSPVKVFLKMSLPEGKSTKILFPDQTTGTIEVLNVTSSPPLFKITK